MKWKQLLFTLMIAVLCSSGDIAAEQSERTGLRNFRFARSLFSGNEDSNVQRYHCLWFFKRPSSRLLLEPIKFGSETSKTVAVRNFKMKEPLFYSNGKIERIIKLGQTMYIRPDFGVEHERGSRDFGMEVGFRYLF